MKEDPQQLPEIKVVTKDDVIRLLDLGRLLKSVLSEDELANLRELLSNNEKSE